MFLLEIQKFHDLLFWLKHLSNFRKQIPRDDSLPVHLLSQVIGFCKEIKKRTSLLGEETAKTEDITDACMHDMQYMMLQYARINCRICILN